MVARSPGLTALPAALLGAAISFWLADVLDLEARVVVNAFVFVAVWAIYALDHWLDQARDARRQGEPPGNWGTAIALGIAPLVAVGLATQGLSREAWIAGSVFLPLVGGYFWARHRWRWSGGLRLLAVAVLFSLGQTIALLPLSLDSHGYLSLALLWGLVLANLVLCERCDAEEDWRQGLRKPSRVRTVLNRSWPVLLVLVAGIDWLRDLSAYPTLAVTVTFLWILSRLRPLLPANRAKVLTDLGLALSLIVGSLLSGG